MRQASDAQSDGADSVDRNSLGHFGDLTRSEYWASSYLDPTFEGEEPGWEIRGQPWHVRVEALDFEIHNVRYNLMTS